MATVRTCRRLTVWHSKANVKMMNTAHVYSDTKLQLENHDIMNDSQDFCLDFDNDSDTRVNHNFEYDSEQVAIAEEVTLIKDTDDPIEITQTILLRHTNDQRIEMVENVLQYVQACAQEDKVLQSLEKSSTTDGPEGTVYNKCLNRGWKPNKE